MRSYLQKTVLFLRNAYRRTVRFLRKNALLAGGIALALVLICLILLLLAGKHKEPEPTYSASIPQTGKTIVRTTKESSAPETSEAETTEPPTTEPQGIDPMTPVGYLGGGVYGDGSQKEPDYSALPVPAGVSLEKATADDVYRYGGYFRKNADQKVIYLTFCIGTETGYTSWILDVLKDYSVPASFFVVTKEYCEGWSVPENSARLKRMLAEGHLVGSHGYRHQYTSEMSAEYFIEEAYRAQAAMDACLGYHYPIRYYRPPYGFLTPRDAYLCQKLGLTPTMYSFSYADYGEQSERPREEALAALKGALSPGAIYYLHSGKCNADSLAEFIEFARSEGYTFLRIDEYMTADGRIFTDAPLEKAE